MADDQVKHLEFIQSVVTRMAGNSFLLKGWSVTLTVALLGLAAKDSNVKFAYLALVPPIFLWGLDAYYLRQERLFRKLFDAVRLQTDAEWAAAKFSMSTANVAAQVDSWFWTLWAGTVCWLHLPVILIVLGILCFLRGTK